MARTTICGHLAPGGWTGSNLIRGCAFNAIGLTEGAQHALVTPSRVSSRQKKVKNENSDYSRYRVHSSVCEGQVPATRLNDAAAVFSEVMAAPDKGIPQEMLEHAHCIVIVPDLKTGAIHCRR